MAKNTTNFPDKYIIPPLFLNVNTLKCIIWLKLKIILTIFCIKSKSAQASISCSILRTLGFLYLINIFQIDLAYPDRPPNKQRDQLELLPNTEAGNHFNPLQMVHRVAVWSEQFISVLLVTE